MRTDKTQRRVRFLSVAFQGYKALVDFTLNLSHMNVLVGANNHGKSTILGAFRILDLGLRAMTARNAEAIAGPNGRRPGWRIPEDSLPVSTENVHTNYRDEDASIVFRLTNGTSITVFFPAEGGCFFYGDSENGNLRTAGDVRRHAPVTLSIVPILGPLEHHEKVVQPETVRRNLATTRASRNFRNYWLLNPEGFEEFSTLVSETWPGMVIHPPEKQDDLVVMFCDENRLARELFWSGFGFQIWLQLLTHISRAGPSTMIVVDEPELYLHPDIQRQLLGILREVGADVLLATHSIEVMSEADPSEIVLIDKSKQAADRLRDDHGLQRALSAIGSIQNITLARLARNRRVLFVEGETDARLIRRFAKLLSYTELAAGDGLTTLASGGFSSWQRVRGLAAAFEDALGFKLHVGAVFDRDYWCDEQIAEIEAELEKHLEFAHLHKRKELENYLLLPDALDRALAIAIDERAERTGQRIQQDVSCAAELETITNDIRAEVQGDYLAKRSTYFSGGRNDASTVTKAGIRLFNARWEALTERLAIVPGKQVLTSLREVVNRKYGVTLSDHRIVTSMLRDQVPSDLVELIEKLDRFRFR